MAAAAAATTAAAAAARRLAVATATTTATTATRATTATTATVMTSRRQHVTLPRSQQCKEAASKMWQTCQSPGLNHHRLVSMHYSPYYWHQCIILRTTAFSEYTPAPTAGDPKQMNMPR